MKYCPKCDTYKPRSEFSANKKHSDGLDCRCRACAVIAVRAWRARNTEYDKARKAITYSEANPNQKRKRASPEYIPARRVVFRNEVERAERRRERNRENARRYRLNVANRLSKSVSASLSNCLRKCGQNKKGRAFSMLGYTAQELMDHVGKQFHHGMSWDNYGVWEIDHIVPLSSFDLSSRAEVIRANRLSNLRPLWKSANRKKKDKIMHLI